MSRFKVIAGDCRDVVPQLGRSFAFVFADPPFNIGRNYRDYNDRMSAKDYEDFTCAWMAVCWQACHGVMALHGPDNVAELYLRFARVLGFADKRIAWVNWHYRFGVCHRHNWIDARCHCLIFAKSKPHTWNPDAVLVQSDRVSYGDKRVGDSPKGGRRLPGTVWGVPSDGPNWGRVQGNNAERTEHDNQLPEVYLERLLRAYTNPGDVVLDPFCGSGTTATVATALGRDCITIDIGPETVVAARDRIRRGPVRVKP